MALNRKNALFAGSAEGGDNWAVIATLIEACKLNGGNPHAWLTATLSKLAAGHPAGFDLARRTVAEYREAIGIGFSVQRRRHKRLARVG